MAGVRDQISRFASIKCLMKKLLILGSFALIVLRLSAQNGHFLFIQSENNQPYYVQTDGKTLSSSAIGHLIISGLRDTIHTLNIGFPKNQYPEQIFKLQLNKKDAGFQLKNLGSEGWALYNLQSLQVTKAQQRASSKQSISYGDVKKTDVFSTLMAGLVNDSAVLYTSVARVEPPKQSSKAGIPDTAPEFKDVANKQVPANDTVAMSAVLQPEPVNPLRDTAAVRKEPQVTLVQPPKDSVAEKLEKIKLVDVKSKDSVKDMASVAIQPEKVVKDSLAVKTVNMQPADRGIDTPAATPTRVDVTGSLPKEGDSLTKAPPVTSVPADSTAVIRKPDSALKSPESPAVVTKPAARPLIVWFSETKTAQGTELVYFDMSKPEKIDTIRILIPRESEKPLLPPSSEIKKDSSSSAPGEQPKETGNFIDRLFGKKKAENQEPPKESTIKVTTVENKPAKTLDSPLVRKSSQKPETTQVGEPIPVKPADEKAGSNSGGFFGKLFGKKDEKKRASDTVAANSSTIKVTTVGEKKSQPDIAKTNRVGKDEDQEVEKLKKAQENEEKTSTERFFGKLFSKNKSPKSTNSRDKTKEQPEDPAKGSSIKVSTVENANPSASSQQKNPLVTNSDCRDFATDSDVDKLRVRMLGEKDADGQVSEARKIFKSKCFTTKQVHSLSSLFRTDEGRYRLLDAAYPFVSDSTNFKDLIVLLTEEYYINRFKAMVRM